MIDYSTAANIASFTFPIALIVVAIGVKIIEVRGMAPKAREPGPYNGDKKGEKICAQPHCLEHSGIEATLKGLSEGQTRIENNTDLIFEKLDKLHGVTK